MDLLTKYYEKILFGLSLFVLLAGAVFFLQRLNSDTLVSPLAPNDVLGKGKVDPEDPQYKPADLVVPKVPELKILEVKGNGMLSPLRYTKCQNVRCGMCIEYDRDDCPFCGTAQPEIPAHPNPDDFDGDGIPNAVEIANGLNPNDPADARQDPMHTGFTNFERLVKYKKYINPQDREKVPPLAFLLRVYKVAPVYFPIVLKKTTTAADGPDAPSAMFRAFPQAGEPAVKALRNLNRNALIYRDQGTSKNINMVVGDKLRQKLRDYKGPDLTVKTINAGVEREVEVTGPKGDPVKRMIMVSSVELVDDANKTYLFTSDEVVDCGDRQVTFIYLVDRNPQQPTAMGGYAGPMGGYAGPTGGYAGPTGGAATGPTGGAATGPTGGATAGGPTVSRRNPMYTVVTGDNKKISLRSPRQMVMGATPGMMGPGMTGGTAMGGGMPGGTDGRPVIEDYVCVSYEEKDGVGVAKVSMMAPVNDPKTLFPIPMFEAASDLFELPMTGGDTGGMPMAGGGDPGMMPDAMPARPVAIPRRPGTRPVRP